MQVPNRVSKLISIYAVRTDISLAMQDYDLTPPRLYTWCLVFLSNLNILDNVRLGKGMQRFK